MVNGINLITLYYTDVHGQHRPVNYRVYDKAFSALCGYVQLPSLCAMDLISNCYRLQRNLFNDVVASFIRAIIPYMENLNSQFQPVVNA